MRTLVANGANLSGNDSAGSILSQKGIPKLETFWPLAERWVLILDAIFKRPENSNPEQWRANSLKLLEILQMHVTGPQKTTEAPKDAATAGHRAAKTEEEPAMTAPRFTNR